MTKGTAVYKCKYCEQKFTGFEGYCLDKGSPYVVNKIGPPSELNLLVIPLYWKHQCTDTHIGVGEFIGFCNIYVDESEDTNNE